MLLYEFTIIHEILKDLKDSFEGLPKILWRRKDSLTESHFQKGFVAWYECTFSRIASSRPRYFISGVQLAIQKCTKRRSAKTSLELSMIFYLVVN
jgi:hypothetical protein